MEYTCHFFIGTQSIEFGFPFTNVGNDTDLMNSQLPGMTVDSLQTFEEDVI